MTWTREQIEEAVNDGRDLVDNALDLGELEQDLLNLVVNAVLTCLDKPGVDFATVVADNYAETPEQIKQWWDW